MIRVGILVLFAFCLLGWTSCKDGKQYYYTPTLDVQVQGGTRGEISAPLNTSDDEYTPYQGSPYWGEGGKSANSHYTRYDSEDRNLNYYRGQEE